MKQAAGGVASARHGLRLSVVLLGLLLAPTDVRARGDDDVMDAAEECHPGWALTNGQCIKEIGKKPMNPCPHKASLEVTNPKP